MKLVSPIWESKEIALGIYDRYNRVAIDIHVVLLLQAGTCKDVAFRQ